MATIQNDNANKNALESLNNSFDTELHKNKKYKWYSPRIGNLVIPQVYDDSLSYYEAINKLQMLIHAEIARAITAENLLGANLDKEIQRAKQAESDLNDALNAEIARAKAEEKRLDNKIDAETDRAKAAEKTITDNLNKEIERAKAAEEALTTALNSEIDRAKAAEKKNADAIAAETTRATNAENALGDRITAETTARQNADKTLDDKITKEVSDRQGADSVLDNKITAEADARKAADTTITQNITNVQNSVNTLSGKAVTDVAMTEENGTYTLTQEKNGVKSNIGTIDVGANNPVVEVSDDIVTNDTDGYNFHTLKETTVDGTTNNIASVYSAQKQVTGIDITDGNLNVKTVDQSGNVETTPHEVVTPAALQEVETELEGKIPTFTPAVTHTNPLLLTIKTGDSRQYVYADVAHTTPASNASATTSPQDTFDAFELTGASFQPGIYFGFKSNVLAAVYKDRATNRIMSSQNGEVIAIICYTPDKYHYLTGSGSQQINMAMIVICHEAIKSPLLTYFGYLPRQSGGLPISEIEFTKIY